MRVLLIHNPDAGRGEHEADELLEALRRRGDEVTLVTTDFTIGDAELLVAAGGDGTVASVVRTMARADAETALLILPVGTANNIARSLGIEKPQLDLDAVRKNWMAKAIDVAVVDDEIVVEAAGCGVIAGFMRAEPSVDRDGVKREAKSLAERVAESPLFDYRITLNDAEIAGEALFIEAMVIRQLGPNIVAAPDADPSDGLLDVVVAGEESREPLLKYLRTGGKRHLPKLETIRTEHVTIACDAPWHLDDRAVERRTRTVAIRRGAWQAMVPRVKT